jgi:hypothetical protein
VTVAIAYRPPAAPFRVSFRERGLPVGTNWSATLSAGSTGVPLNGATALTEWSGGSDSVAVTAYPGSYAYSASPTGYASAAGDVTVNGANLTVPLTFALVQIYQVGLTETGLPAGSAWWVELGGILRSSELSTITFNEPNGSYAWTAGGPADGGVRNVSGDVTVDGQDASVSVTFLVPVALVPLTFRASGLPSGENWSVTLTPASGGLTIEGIGNVTHWSNGGISVTFQVSDGSYAYSIFARGYAANVGRVSVSGTAGATVPVDFVPVSSSPGPGSSPLLVSGWAPAIGLAFLLVGGSGLAVTAYRHRERERERGRLLVEGLYRADRETGAADPRDDQTIH